MRHRVRRPLLFALGLLVLTAAGASAQPVGTLRWQLQPYCNVVTLNITSQGAVFTLDGFDDQCGAAQRASVVGTAFLNPDGSVGIGLNTVLAPGAAFVHLEASISVASLGGPWRDSAGNSGTFAPTPGAGTGRVRRPVAANGLPPGSVTGGQIDPQQVQARVVGECSPGQAIRGIGTDGTVSCTPTGITGYERKEGAINLVSPGQAEYGIAICPPGKKLLSGGAIPSSRDLLMVESWASEDGSTHTVRMRSYSATEQRFSVVVICAVVP